MHHSMYADQQDKSEEDTENKYGSKTPVIGIKNKRQGTSEKNSSKAQVKIEVK